MMAIDLKDVFRMKEGTHDTSYAKASYIQKQLLLLAKPIREKAIREVYFCSKEVPTTMCIADLGCSSAEQNNLSIICELMEAVDTARRELGHGPLEYQIYLNDLPGNDFNTVFRSVTSFEDTLKQKMGDDYGVCFVNGVPGSFYDRLFPTNSLHFVHSSSSIHWLSQIPEGIEDNKQNIFMATTSPPSVIKAYEEQFSKDFSSFLHCRSKEVVAGGRMVLTVLARQDNDPHQYFTTVLSDMVLEGYMEEEKLNTFNLPIYAPSPSELEYLVEKDGSFVLNQVHLSEFDLEPSDYNDSPSEACDENDHQCNFATCMRSVVEPLLITHFGEEIIEEVFSRYRKIVNLLPTKNKIGIVNITISLTRKH